MEQRIVCVLGMQRSGTSVVTRMLNLLGVYLGPEEHLMESRWHNPTGFWEHSGIQALNQELLERLGGTWYRPPSLEPGWEQSSALEPLRQRAQRLIAREFGDARLWGWKDPSTSLTLPFWQAVLPPMHYVVCLRDPLGSARSLQVRDKRSLEDSVCLWFSHVQSALEHTDRSPRIAVFYDEVMHSWSPVLQHLADFVGLSDRARDPDIRQAVANFIRPDLNHHRPATDSEADDVDPDVLATAKDVYETLKRESDLRQDTVLPLLDAACRRVQAAAERGRRREYELWLTQRDQMIAEISAVIPPTESLILVDSNELGLNGLPGRRIFPFLERDGEYWGAPADDETAIRELERLRATGAHFLTIAWPAFLWWLTSYPAFDEYVRTHFPCLLESDRVRVFDLQATA